MVRSVESLAAAFSRGACLSRFPRTNSLPAITVVLGLADSNEALVCASWFWGASVEDPASRRLFDPDRAAEGKVVTGERAPTSPAIDTNRRRLFTVSFEQGIAKELSLTQCR